MAKAHKLAGTGLGLHTALSDADLISICLAAAPQATGTIWKGQERITLVRQTDTLLVFEMAALIKSIKRMIFSMSISEQNGRRQLLTTINDYMTTRWMLWGMIPIGPREMVAHYVYVEFLELVAKTVRQADPTAVARLELGPFQRASIPNPPPAAAVTATPAVAPPADPAPVPTPVVVAAAPVPESAPAPPVEDEPEVDRTMIVERRPRQPQWSLAGDDGVDTAIAGRTVLGRDPRAVDERDAIAVVGLDDASVSASHAVVEVREGRLHVTDLGSTNGTVVLDVDGAEHACTPGVPVEVAEGAAIELGAYTLVARSHLRRAR